MKKIQNSKLVWVIGLLKFGNYLDFGIWDLEFGSASPLLPFFSF